MRDPAHFIQTAWPLCAQCAGYATVAKGRGVRVDLQRTPDRMRRQMRLRRRVLIGGVHNAAGDRYASLADRYPRGGDQLRDFRGALAAKGTCESGAKKHNATPHKK